MSTGESRLNLVLTGEDVNASESLSRLSSELSKLNEKISSMSELFGKFSESISSFGRDIGEAGSSISNASNRVTRLGSNMDKQSQAISQAAEAISKGLESVALSSSDIASVATKNMPTLSRSIEETGVAMSGAMDNLNTKVKAVKDTIVVTEQELRSLTDLSKLLTPSGAPVQSSMLSASQLRTLYGKQTGQNVVLTKPKEKSGGMFSMESSMNQMYAGMTMGMAAAPLDLGIKSALNSFTQFSGAMANVNSMAGMSTKQLNQMSQQVIALSKTVPLGPVQLANALYGVVGAGVPAADAMSFLKTASEASVAGQTDLTTATNALVYVMGAYGLKAKDIGQVSDQMFAANAAGAMTFEQFARSLGTVAGAAAQAGVPFSQVSAATAALTNEGLSAQRSTLGLRALLMGIVNPTKGAAAEARSLGIQWDQNTLKSKGLVGMLQEAMKATHGNGQELKKLIPNIAAWTVAVDLGGKGAQSFNNAMKQMNNSSGATSRAITAQEQGLTEKMQAMHAAIQTAQIAFVQGFAPALTRIAQDVTKLAQAFAKLSPHTQKLIADIALGAAAFFTISAPILMVTSGIGQMLALFRTASGELNLFGRVAKMAFSTALGPWGLLIAAVVIGVYEVITHWKQIRTFLVNLWNGIRTDLQTGWQEIKQMWENLSQSAVGLAERIWGAVTGWFSSLWSKLKSFFAKWGPDLLLVLAPFIGVPLYIYQHFQQIETWLKDVWDKVKGVVKNGAQAAVDDVRNILDGLGSYFTHLGQEALQWGGNLIHMFAQGIRNAASEVVNEVKSVASSVSNFLGFHSPTKQGPGSDADTWAPNFMNMYTSGIKSHIPQLQTVLNAALVTPFNNNAKMELQNSGYALAGGLTRGGGATSGGVHFHGNIVVNTDNKNAGFDVARQLKVQISRAL